MPFLNLPTDIRIYYERRGKGPPLILIMGTGLNCSFWNSQIEAYQHFFECISFDNRGTGKTTASRDRLTVRLLAQDTAALIEALGLGPAHISGLSLGSCIAQELTLRQPELVRTLQLHGTWGQTNGYANKKFRTQIHLLEQLDIASFYEINLLWLITPEYMDHHPDQVAKQMSKIIQNAPEKELLKQQYEANLYHDTLDQLYQIQVPTLITVGSFDLAVPPMYSREVASAIPKSELVVFQNGGHLHNFEQPEEFNKVTLDFLKRNTVYELSKGVPC